jgi:hypothetical protein
MTPNTCARWIGALSLVALVCGSFPIWVASRLVVPGDAAATAANLIEHERLFRLGVVSMMMMNVVYLFAAALWYQLLRPVHRDLARLMLLLIAMSFAIALANELHPIAALRLAGDGMTDAMARELELHEYGLLTAGIFNGLWLFPLGLLVFRSGFLPKALGALLMIGCFGYLIRFVQGFLFPGAAATIWTNPFVVVTHFAELAMMLWLLAKGVGSAHLAEAEHAAQRVADEPL